MKNSGRETEMKIHLVCVVIQWRIEVAMLCMYGAVDILSTTVMLEIKCTRIPIMKKWSHWQGGWE